MRAYRTLRSRLFSWFVGAILLAIVTGSLVGLTTRPEPLSGAEAMARHVGDRFAIVWDDADAARAYAQEIRDVRGGVLVGAVEMGRFGGHLAPWGWWRFVLGLVLVGFVLSLMAGAIAD